MIEEEKRIKTKSQLKEWLNYESKYYGSGNYLRIIYPVTEGDVLKKHQILLRKTEYHKNVGHRIRGIIFSIFLLRYQNRYSIHIPINTFAKGLRLIHVGPRLVNGNVSVGEDCVLHINTALVAGGTNDGCPTLGKNIIMGINSVALGELYIANGVAVGANAVVNKSVLEENIAVAGVPAKKISDNGRNKWRKEERGH